MNDKNICRYGTLKGVRRQFVQTNVPNVPDSIDLLESLVAFDTTSANSNLELIHWARNLLLEFGASVSLISNSEKTKANLYATIGPKDAPGIMLSGHTDVVPVAGQQWSTSPFKLSVKDAKAYGRGTADMKGFIACALRAVFLASGRTLRTPLHLALSYDEEIGCVGVHSLLDMLAQAPFRPLMCLVGEPTELKVATGHKGKMACHVNCIGKAAHSSLAPQATNAIHLATDLISRIRQRQISICGEGHQDSAYEVPYTTLHASNIRGGVALNIVPDQCQFDLEIRNLAEDDAGSILEDIRDDAAQIVTIARQLSVEADICLDVFNTYPGLNTDVDSRVVDYVKSLTGQNAPIKVAFGTEAGLFSTRLSIPSVVCGPGSMQQGHKPDEYISLDQLHQCDVMLDRLIVTLEQGVPV